MLPHAEGRVTLGSANGRRSRHPAEALALAVALTAWSCLSQVDPVAPEGATLLVNVEPAPKIDPSETATVRTTLFSVSGDLLDYDVDVTVLVRGSGVLCDAALSQARCDRGMSELPNAVTLRAKGGVGNLMFRSGPTPDTVVIVARSGTAVDSTTLYVEEPVTTAKVRAPVPR